MVPGYGCVPAKIMFIGLAPGRNGADITGIPFTRDPSGVLFQKALINAGLSKETDPHKEKPALREAYVTNLVKCNPKDSKGNNRTPSRNEIHNCMEFLKVEEELVKPRVIIPLGKHVSECILGTKIHRMSEIHGRATLKGNVVVIPFIHPSYVVRGAYHKKRYMADFKSIRSLNGKRLKK